ncbi:MAG: c-type cytochrome [Gammaproteobacteria bacterium]
MYRIVEEMRSVSPLLLSLLAMVLASPVSGQAEEGGAGKGDHELRPASVTDTSSVDLGRSLFRMACAACHGIDARGGRGPDLTLGEFAHGKTRRTWLPRSWTEYPGPRCPRPTVCRKRRL